MKVKSILSEDNSLMKRPLFFYCAGVWCKKILQVRHFLGINPDFLVDSNPALWGTAKTMDKYKPKLAVCLYHKIKDLWEIPEYLKRKFPFYNIYIRHHGYSTVGTVCYAIPRV